MRSGPLTRARLPSLSATLKILAALIGLAIPAFVAATLSQQHTQALNNAELRAANTARALEQHAARTFETIDTYLQAVTSLVGPRAGSAPPEVIHAALRDQMARSRHLNNLMIIDRDGRSLFEAVAFPARPLDVSNRDYFQTLRDQPGAGLVVGRPIVGRLTGETLLPVARRIDNPDGSFAGVVQAMLRPAAFQSVYDALDNGPGAALSLWRSDGLLLVRSPHRSELVGQTFASSDTYRQHVLPRNTRPFWLRSSLDGVERVVALGFLDGHPLYVTAALGVADALTQWRESAVRQALVAGGLTLVLVPALLWLAREVGRRQASEAEVRASEARYRLLAENTSDVVIWSGLDTTRRYVSPAAQAVFGYAPEELVGTRPLDFVHPDDAGAFRRVLDDLTQGRVERATSQQRYRRNDGSWVWIEGSFSLTRDPHDDRATGYVASLRDVSARKAAERAAAESEARYREVLSTAHAAILGQLAEGVIVADAAGHITFVNAAAARIHGLARLDVAPDAYSATYSLLTEDGTPYPSLDLPLARAVRGETVRDARWRVRRPDGEEVLAIGTAQPLRGPDGGQIGAVLTLRDDTAREAAERGLRESEARLRELNATLAERVAERTREADEARAQAEAASRAKTDFLATISHEVRTPLNGVLGYADLLLNELSPGESARRHATRIRDAGCALLTVVNDVLDFSKIEAGRIDLDPRAFSPSALIDACASIGQGAAENKGVEVRAWLDPALPAWLMGDADRLRQVLLNLVNNAVKFTAQGHVEIRAERLDEGDGAVRLRIAVADTGIGIPADRLGGLFERFAQVDGSISRRFGGTGLGLAICKRLVELMGGAISVQSEEGQGSTFALTLTLPVCEPAETAPADLAGTPSGSPGRRSRSARVLLVEDLDINQDLARAILERAGHTVDVASDGAEAVQAVQRAAYDVVLMDVQMPVMDGLEATRRIRGLAGPAREVPIVALTANVLTEQVARFRDAGLDDHVGKPFRRDELLAAVARWSGAGDAPAGRRSSSAGMPVTSDSDAVAEAAQPLCSA